MSGFLSVSSELSAYGCVDCFPFGLFFPFFLRVAQDPCFLLLAKVVAPLPWQLVALGLNGAEEIETIGHPLGHQALQEAAGTTGQEGQTQEAHAQMKHDPWVWGKKNTQTKRSALVVGSICQGNPFWVPIFDPQPVGLQLAAKNELARSSSREVGISWCRFFFL